MLGRSLCDIAKEITHLVKHLRSTPKKALVLDLDNTLWGGVIGEDGIEGIELGNMSARGESFQAFQKYLLTLSQRGVLLAVCSKNDYEVAIEPFIKHSRWCFAMSILSPSRPTGIQSRTICARLQPNFRWTWSIWFLSMIIRGNRDS